MWYFFTSSYMQLQNNKIPFRQNNKTTKKTKKTWRLGCLMRNRNYLPFASTCVHPRLLVGSCRSSFWFLCCVFLFGFILILCLVYPMLPVSLDCPFLIVPSIFSNVNCIAFHFRLKISYVVIGYCS